jgi:hypothetical protein
VLLPSLDFCFSQLVASAGAAPYPAAREALLMACSHFILGVLRCEGYAGRASSTATGGAPSTTQVPWQPLPAPWCGWAVLSSLVLLMASAASGNPCHPLLSVMLSPFL